MKFIVGASHGNVTCMALYIYLSIYPGRMEGPPTSASNYTPFWYNLVGSSTAVLSATGTGGAAYGISVNNSYTAINTTSVPSQYPSASWTAREGQTEDNSDCTVGTSDVEYDCTVVSHDPCTQNLIFCFWSYRNSQTTRPFLPQWPNWKENPHKCKCSSHSLRWKVGRCDLYNTE